jgi:hypothetical protein
MRVGMREEPLDMRMQLLAIPIGNPGDVIPGRSSLYSGPFEPTEADFDRIDVLALHLTLTISPVGLFSRNLTQTSQNRASG